MKRGAILSGLAVVFFSTAAGAVRVPLPPELKEASLNINVQMQAWNQALENAGPPTNSTPPVTSWDDRIFLRRARLYVSGDFTKKIPFFFNIDSPNLGREAAGAPMALAGAGRLQHFGSVF